MLLFFLNISEKQLKNLFANDYQVSISTKAIAKKN